MTPPVSEFVLLGVNRTRRAFGIEPLDELPKGRRGHSSRCPLARALAPVGVTHVNTYVRVKRENAHRLALAWKVRWPWPDPESPGHMIVEAPAWVTAFIHNFDSGLLPGLEERGNRRIFVIDEINLVAALSKLPIAKIENLTEEVSIESTHTVDELVPA